MGLRGAILLENLEQLVDCGPLLSLLQTELYRVFEHERVSSRYALENPLLDPLIELAHVLAPEWGSKAAELVDNAAERPHVTIVAVWLIVPYFWASIVGSSRLSFRKPFLEGPRDIQVPDLQLLLRGKEQVCGFQIPMYDLERVQVLQA